MNTTFKSGQYNVICDICGFKFKNVELKKDWRGLMVCKDDFELRNPQDFIRVKPERVAPPWVRPRPGDVFIEVCTIVTSQGVAGKGTAGCAVAGKQSNAQLT